MEKIKLTQCPVIFNEREHTYTLNDKQLSGITSIIHRYIFPDMYKDVSERILQNAANRGTAFHNMVQLLISGIPIENDVELLPFINATKGINFIASEYLVTDYDSVASSIDLVGQNEDGTVTLYDIKTTSVLNTEYLQWQLTIYKHLFKIMNPDIDVKSIAAIHVTPTDTVVVEVEPLPNEYIADLFHAFRNNADTFTNPLHQVPTELEDLLKQYAELELKIAEVDAIKTPLDEQKREIQNAISDYMVNNNTQKLENDKAKITLGKDSVRETFDLKTFKQSEVFKKYNFSEYIKTTNVKGRLTITIK